MAKNSQQRYRGRLARLYQACPLTKIDDRRFLIASHIKPKEVCEDGEETDEANGLLLASHIDHLFDKGFITFDDDGTIRFSEAFTLGIAQAFGVSAAAKIEIKDEKTKEYLKYHKEHIFEKRYKQIFGEQ
jgi:hypothetical protein